jgi:N-formylglutamate amidohydrolase
MILPFLISIPHAGLKIPPEVSSLWILTEQQINEGSDAGALEIYSDLKKHVSAFVTTDIAQVIVDVNRAENDFSPDGVIKTHNCYNVPVFKKFPDEELCRILLNRYYRPYHRELTEAAKSGPILGIDCHTMAVHGPPVGPDPGMERPLVCLGNAEKACPEEWLKSLAACFAVSFQTEVSLNKPFPGGHIIRHHSRELPWVQLELSRTTKVSNQQKVDAVRQALVMWCSTRM